MEYIDRDDAGSKGNGSGKHDKPPVVLISDTSEHSKHGGSPLIRSDQYLIDRAFRFSGRLALSVRLPVS
jgi:hypothetical protein